METIENDIYIKHVTNKKVNPISKDDAQNLFNGLNEKYCEILLKVQNASFVEKQLILKKQIEELNKLKEELKSEDKNIYEKYEKTEIEFVWYNKQVLERIRELFENIHTRPRYIKYLDLFCDLFVKYYYSEDGIRIHKESIISNEFITLNDTQWRADTGKEIKEYELKNNPNVFLEISREEAEIIENFFMQDLNIWYTNKIRKAVSYALYYYKDLKRKTSNQPYIAHALETLLITSTMTSDESVLITSILHGIIKNTNANISDIKRNFGNDVALNLIYITNMAENFENNKEWSETQKNILYKLENAKVDIKIIILANELSNLREIDRDFKTYKDGVWNKFSEEIKQQHIWYHEEMLTKLKELRLNNAYEEYQKLIYMNF